MVRFYQHIGSLAAALYCTTAGAASATPVFPGELMLDGKPLEPYCMEHFFGDSSRFEPVNLRNCGVEDVLPSSPASVNEQGDYGYEYVYRDSGEGLSASYIYYRYIGRKDGLPLLLLRESGGGSGQFSALVKVRRDGDVLKLVEEIAGGDRCNGGIDAQMDGENLSFTQSITPHDFLELAGDNPHGLSAYDDLEASASSCYGKARYVNGKLEDIALTSTGEDFEGWTEKLPYQLCFNRLYRQSVAAGKTRLSRYELQEFTHNFNTTCVDQPTKPE